MNDALTAAAERPIALPGFRWMPGMVDTDGDRAAKVFTSGIFASNPDGESCVILINDMALPDLTDPATIGCVLAMVREAWKDPGIGAVQSQSLAEGEPTWWLLMTATQLFDAATEAECLVNALAAASQVPA